MSFFYIKPDTISLTNNTCLIDGQEFAHITKVMRLSVGDSIELTDGIGTVHYGQIQLIQKSRLTVGITSTEKQPLPSKPIAVALSLLRRQERFEFFLEKATELGASEILPMLTERTVSKPQKKQLEKKKERWEKIIQSAAKQSQRAWFPKLHDVRHFNDAIKMGFDQKVIPHEKALEPIEISPKPESILFCIGPEGGFSQAEIDLAIKHGFKTGSLGPNVLRAETAAIHVCSLALYAHNVSKSHQKNDLH